jgi:hypothetical protein
MSIAEGGRFRVDFPGVATSKLIEARGIQGEGIDSISRSQISASIRQLVETEERYRKEQVEAINALAAKEAMVFSVDYMGYKVAILHDRIQNLGPVRVTQGEESVFLSPAEPVTRFQAEGRKNGKYSAWLITLPDELSGIGPLIHGFNATIIEKRINQLDHTVLGLGQHVPLFGAQGRFPVEPGRSWKIGPEGTTSSSKASVIALTILGEMPKCTFNGHLAYRGASFNPSEISRLSFHLHL